MIRRFALASAILIAAASATPAAPAMAATATGDLSVSATVPVTCSVSVPDALAFGTYDPLVANAELGNDLYASTSVSVTCSSGASATITLGQGANPDPDSSDVFPFRRLKNGSNYISYALFQNSSRTTIWANTSGTGVGVTGNGSAQTLTIYGEISAAQTASPGSYTDTVTATITY
jgi:spore coat protein U-like protein